MQENAKKIVVTYTPSITMQDTFMIRLEMSNELGYVKDAKALFNMYGGHPGSEGFCYLEYVETSSEGTSIFCGRMAFNKPGYRTFYIQLRLNNVIRYVEISSVTGNAEIVENGKEYAFWPTFVYYSSFKTPDFVKGGVMYQIFVDTFCREELENLSEEASAKIVSWNTYPKWRPDSDGEYRNDQFYGGNLRGIISKLDYIASLGTTVIYLTPIFKSPSQNRYDIEDYEEIDELVGTWEDLDNLHKAANEKGMKLIIDLVFNHSSSKNKLLEEEPDMYDWFIKYTQPKCWWGYKGLVEFNKWNELFYNKMNSWLNIYDAFVDGYRFDVADSLYDQNLKAIRTYTVPKYLLGEVWKNAITGDYREFFYGDELDGVMNYQYPNAIYRYIIWGNIDYFKKIVLGIYNLYPYEALAVSPIFISSHDIPRPLSIVGDQTYMQPDPYVENVWDMENSADWRIGGIFDTLKFRTWEVEHEQDVFKNWERVFSMLRIVLLIQYSLPGLPSIFAGDEAGVIGFKDPTNRKPFPWDNINNEVLEVYKKLGEFRNGYREIFMKKNFHIIKATEDYIIYNRDELIFVVNRSDKELDLSEYIIPKIKLCLGEYNPKTKVLGKLSGIVF